MSLFEMLFGTHKKRENAENTAVAKPVAPVKTNQPEYDFITPGLFLKSFILWVKQRIL